MNVKEFFEKKDKILSDGFKFHHRSLERGYRCKDDFQIDNYSGRFGVGYKIHMPNSYMSVSNRYHVVEYYIK